MIPGTTTLSQHQSLYFRPDGQASDPVPVTGFQVGPTFPYFFDLLLFHENALLSLLFRSKM